MNLWHVIAGVAAGTLLGYGGARLAPRWMDRPPHTWALGAAAGANGLLAALLAAEHGVGGYFWTHLVFLSVLTVCSLVDLYDRIIPNELVLFGLAAGLLLLFAAPYPERSWIQALGGAAAGFGGLLALALLVKGGMGEGDVKLAAVIGLFLGYQWIGMGMIFAFLSGGAVSGVLLALRRVGRKSMIPFGPFLAFGSALTVLYGERIWNWYIGI